VKVKPGEALLRLLDETVDLFGSLEIHMGIGVGAIGGVERPDQLSPPIRVGLVECLQVLRHERLCVLHWFSDSMWLTVELRHVAGELLGDRGESRRLERAGGDHDLVGVQRAVGQLDAVAAIGGVQAGDVAVELDGAARSDACSR
jgi:hypothetical protein